MLRDANGCVGVVFTATASADLGHITQGREKTEGVKFP